jgi:hypothetical protein
MPPPPSCTPEGIEAPWYDPLVPDSADVLGIVVESMRLSSPVETRISIERLLFGSKLWRV